MFKKYYISKEDLFKYYITEKRSNSEIAKIIGCSPSVVIKNLKLYSIPLRNKREIALISNSYHKTNCSCFICKAKRGECKKENNSFFGKKHTEETKKIIGKSRKKYKDKKASHYIDGRSTKIYYCIDNCGQKVSKKGNRCKSCAQKEERNHSYIDGRSYEKYPFEFNQKLRDKIRKRDLFTCQSCGMTEKEHLSIYRRRLSLHHINYDKKNCSKSNLITLCVRCHRKTNHNKKEWVVLLNCIMKKIFRLEDIEPFRRKNVLG